MLWVLEVGNTKIASCLYDLDFDYPVPLFEAISDTQNVSHGIQQMYDAVCKNLSETYPNRRVQRIIIASVVESVNKSTVHYATNHSAIHQVKSTDNVIQISPSMSFPDKIGQDRLLNAAAIKGQNMFPCLIADIGTATTIDYINENAVFAGGIITVGADMMLTALHQQTDRLPQAYLTEKPETILGTCTQTALQAGTFWGMRGILSGIVRQFRDAFGCPLPLVLTGGGAWIVQDMLQPQDYYWRTLTRDGLFYYDKMMPFCY